MATNYYIKSKSEEHKVTPQTFQKECKLWYYSFKQNSIDVEFDSFIDVVHGISSKGELDIEIYLDIPKILDFINR